MSQADTLIDRQASTPPRLPHRSQSGRLACVVVMIGALLLTAVAQQFARDARTDLLGASIAQSRVGNLDSFALSLVLGGLRGPLVMALWSSSETQKSAKDLEDFDTKVELIRLLQPEFDSVHLFQIWNKAYNVSAQRVNLPNKYTEILDAVRYARSVDAQRPDDINIVTAEGMIFSDKLGTSHQKDYFRKRVRAETKWRDTSHEPAVLSAEQRPTKLAPMLDKDGYLNPAALARYPELKDFQPYHDGVSTLAIAYSLLEHARNLSVYEHQKHLQMSELVIDSRSALAVKAWFEEEFERARLAEADAFGETVPALNIDEQVRRRQLDVIGITVTFPARFQNPARAQDAIEDYDLALRLEALGTKKMQEHADRYKNMFDIYRSYRDIFNADSDMIRADRDVLLATQNSSLAAEKLPTAIKNYRRAANEFRQVLLQYFVEDGAAKMCGYHRESLPSVDDTAGLIELTTRVNKLYDLMKSKGNSSMEIHADDWNEMGASIERCGTRAAALDK